MFSASVVVAFQKLAIARDISDDAAKSRKGLLITLVGTGFGICTVDLRSAAYCFLMLLLGSGG